MSRPRTPSSRCRAGCVAAAAVLGCVTGPVAADAGVRTYKPVAHRDGKVGFVVTRAPGTQVHAATLTPVGRRVPLRPLRSARRRTTVWVTTRRPGGRRLREFRRLRLRVVTRATAVPRMFARDSVWNRALTRRAAVVPDSAEMVRTLTDAVRREAAAGTGPALAARSRASLYHVGARAPRVPVVIDSGPWASALAQAMAGGVPIPANAVPSPGSDGAMAIYQRATDTYWDFFQLQQALHPPRWVGRAQVMAGGSLGAGSYRYKITAMNERGESTAVRRPLTVDVPAAGATTLRWGAITGATGYRIYRGDPGGAIGLVATLPATDTSFADEGVVNPGVQPPQVNGASTPGQWRAAYGGQMQRASASPGYFRDRAGPNGVTIERFGWGASATSLPLAAGMVTRADLERGRIDHALALGLPNDSPETSVIAASRWVHPAQRTDGKSSRPAAIPEGTRLRLDPKLNLDRLRLTPFVRMLADAAQRYGAIVQDGSAGTVIYGEDPTPLERRGGRNFYDVHVGSRRPGYLARFPWKHLQVVSARSCRDPARACPP